LFRSPEGLVEFVRSGAEHDMSQLARWPELVERITPEDVVPLPDDRYELDLVVDNLRGGYDSWDPDIVIRAGEIARDIAYALQLEPVQAALAPGSPLRRPRRDDADHRQRRHRRLLRPPETQKNRGRSRTSRLAHDNRKDLGRRGLARLTPDQGASVLGDNGFSMTGVLCSRAARGATSAARGGTAPRRQAMTRSDS